MANLQPADYITITMARNIQEAERVFHAVASPMPVVAVQPAKQVHDKQAVYSNSPGGVDAIPEQYSLYSTSDAGLKEKEVADFALADIVDLSARGALDVAFLSGAQIARYGRLTLS